MLRYEDTTALPLLLHLNSEPWLNLDAYAATSAEVPFAQHAAPARCVELPSADADGALAQAITSRRSQRAFARRSLPLALLSRLLQLAYGVQSLVALPDGMQVLQRPVPSAGALYPLTLHLLLQRVEGVADGHWCYEPLQHRLAPMGPAPPADELAAMLLAQPFVADANLLVWLVAEHRRTMAKYGMRGYRYLHLEAGHVAQSLCLLAADAGLASLCIGGFRDHLVNRWLKLDSREALALYALAAGWPEPTPSSG